MKNVKIKNCNVLNNNKNYKVYNLKRKEVLFIGNYDMCVEYLILNKDNISEILSLDDDKEFIIENNLGIIGSRTFNNYLYAKQHIIDIIKKK